MKRRFPSNPVIAALVILGMALPGVAAEPRQLQPKQPFAIQWASGEATKPLLLPPGYSVSKYGRGQYRVDGPRSYGRVDAIHILFQAARSLNPASVPSTQERPFATKRIKGTWRSYRTSVEGRQVTRREVLLPNPLPRAKKGDEADFIWMRIDATSPEILNALTPIAEAILEDAS